MSDSINDDSTDSEFSKYIPRRHREQQRTSESERSPYVASASTSAGPSEGNREQRVRSDLWPEPVPDFAQRREDGLLAQVVRMAMVAGVAAAVALLVVFGKPLLDGVRPLFGSADSPTRQITKSADFVTKSADLVTKSADQVEANATAVNSALAPATAIAAVPANSRGVDSAIRGVTAGEIRFGISAPFTGPAKELGQHMKQGIEAAFNVANANGGIYGRQLRLVAADDGYEPARTAATMKQLYEKDQVFGLVGNVGTPTAVVALPYTLDRKMLFFGAFTGAGLLRNEPPDRYVFNYRASYAEETAAVVNYLVKVRRLLPEQIAVFAQQDAYGDAGFAGVEKAIRSLRRGNASPILRLNYQRNTVDVEDAVAQLQQYTAQLQQKKHLPIKAVIMVPTYRAAAKFIEKTRALYPDMIYTSVSFVGSTALAEELMLLGKKYAAGVIVTQVVPALDGHSSLVLDYKSALAKYVPGEICSR